ncbi:MAG: PLDc N-terminal domain-containing protein [Cyclobacteriaceae bacterium]
MNNIMYIVALVAAVWVLYEVWTQQKGMSTGSKIIWSICALLFSIITAIVYFFMKKR